MKHQLTAAFATIVFSSMLSPSAIAEAIGPNYFKVRGVANNDMLMIRTKPDHKSQRIGRIPASARCVKNLAKIRNNTWTKIKYGGVIGWVNGKYLAGSNARCGTQTTRAPKRAAPKPRVATTITTNSAVDIESLPFAKTYPMDGQLPSRTENEPSKITTIPMAKTFPMPAAETSTKAASEVDGDTKAPTVSDSDFSATRRTVPVSAVQAPRAPGPGEKLGGFVGVLNVGATGHLNVRSEPAVSAKKVGQFDAGTTCMRVTRRNKDDSWVYINTRALSGWVSSQYLGSVDKHDCFLKHPRGL